MLDMKQIRWESTFIARRCLGALRWPKRRAIERSGGFEPAVIVPISGGLGNQIWQYAIGALVSRCSGLPVKYDLMWNYGPVMDIKREACREFLLPKLFPCLVISEASKEESFLYRRYFWREPARQCVFEEDICFSKRARYLGGFCANAQYMALLPGDFWNQFEFKADLEQGGGKILEQIKASNSVAVHIRRGDYAGSIHDVVTPLYYRQAVEFLTKTSGAEPVFFVFSDDMNWAAETLKAIGGKFIYAKQECASRDILDFFLMSRCRHYIIANSTFSWMAAWLGRKDDSVVTMPDRWFNNKAPRHIFYGNEKAFYVDGYTTIPC